MIVIIILHEDLEEAAYILGMKIYGDRSKRLLRLSQSMYIDTMLKQFSIENFKKSYLSIGHEISLSKKNYSITPQEREHMSKILYVSVVGSIIYAMICTRSNVAYLLGVVSRYL